MQLVGGCASLAVGLARVKTRETKSASTAGSCRTYSVRIAAQFSDPLTTLPQLFLQDAYTTENYGTKARGIERSRG